MAVEKTLHSIVLDAGPILKNEPAVDTLLAKSDHLLTVPSVISEIRDQNARRRVETFLLPFVTVKTPQPQSLEFVINFAKKSGDFSLLSRTDLEILALTYETQIQQNGSSRLRHFPGQKLAKTSNGSNPIDEAESAFQVKPTLEETTDQVDSSLAHKEDRQQLAVTDESQGDRGYDRFEGQDLSENLDKLVIQDTNQVATLDQPQTASEVVTQSAIDPNPSDSEGSVGWITPSNLKKHQAQDAAGSSKSKTDDPNLSVACITSDFAMQNVLLQIGLGLLSPSLHRIRTIKTHIFRCHACFQQVKDTSKQFCPRCGNPTLTRVSCSTNQKGEFRIHLKKNMEWHHRGERYSLPKPVSGSASGKAAKTKGGGKGGWGQQIILTEDQKEYQRAVSGIGTVKAKDLMDEDYLPSILTGERGRAGGRPKVGAGRNVNSKKRVK